MLDSLFTNFEVSLELTVPMLGTVPKDKDVYASYIATKAPTEEEGAEEVKTVPDQEELENRGWTGFHQDEDGRVFIYSYMVKGFLKTACSALKRHNKSLSFKLTAHRKRIADDIFVTPRRVYPENFTKLGVMERPLRAETAQGPRVTLARSDTLPEGTVLKFTVKVLDPKITEAVVKEWFEYAEFQCLGQWRTAGHGTAIATVKKL